MIVKVEDALKEFNIQYTSVPEHFQLICPFHNDTSPSGNIHHKTGRFHCWVCKKKASLAVLLAKYSNLPVYQVKKKLGVRSDCKNPLDINEVELYHNAIWNHPHFLKELANRFITESIIRTRRLGVKDFGTEKRITIPIPNMVGEYANLRCYIPGAAERKFINLSGKDRAKTRFYPYDQLEYDQILVCGGELKALAAAEVLNKYDIGAIAPTCGENSWPNELTNELEGKLIYVNCDVDETGDKYSELRCKILKPVAREVHLVKFTLDEVGGLQKGDINDFLRLGGDLYNKILDSPEWVPLPGGELIDEPASEIEFRNAFSPDNVGKRLKITGIISGVHDNDYEIPATVEVRCTRDQEFCMFCDVNSKALSNETQMDIHPEHPTLLSLIGESDEKNQKTYKECFRIPAKCRVCTFHPKKYYSVTEVRLEEQLSPTARVEPLTMKIGYVVNSPGNLLDAQTFNLTGRLHPSPKNQIASFLVSGIESTQDALDAYTATSADYLTIFRPDEWTLESLESKLNEIYDDLEANVTRIWQRRDYHIAVDLCYHSLLHFNLGDIKDLNAYTEVLIIGDTAQGKSKVMNSLVKHYGLGKKVDSKNVSLPGLTIALEKSNTKYFSVMGVLPRNDRRLVIFEELKGMHPKVFQGLTEIRSSGIVQISKIEHTIRQARVRLLCISNPIDTREVASYTYGVESAVGVIGTNEDLRRFDLVVIVAKGDIKELPELANPPVIEHKFRDDLCQKLILKAWKCESVSFEDVGHILSVTKTLVKKFGNGPPLLDPNSSHLKVAKLSAALAARTCSYEDDVLIVRKCHVDFIHKYLDRVYSSPSCRLDEKSKKVEESTILRDIKGLSEFIRGIANARDIALKIAETDTITSSFIKELCGDYFVGSTLFSKLIQTNALQRIKGDRYAKTPQFTNLLHQLQINMELPNYLKEKEKF